MPRTSSAPRGRSAERTGAAHRWLRRAGDADHRAGRRTAAVRRPRAGAAPAIRCAACGHAVTDRRQRVARDGRTRHAFVNPAGLVFEIGCFRRAPGCRAVGAASTEWTWFAGCAWRVGLCARCGAHLGWQYRGAGGAFFGLILDRLVEEAGPPP